MENTRNFNSLSRNMISYILDFFLIFELREFFKINKRLKHVLLENKTNLLKAYLKIKQIILKKRLSIYDEFSVIKNEFDFDYYKLTEEEFKLAAGEAIIKFYKERDQIILTDNPRLIINNVFLYSLRSNFRVKKVIVYDGKFPSEYLIKLLTTINTNYYCKNSLVALDLSGVNLTKDDVEVLSKFIKVNSFLKTLYLNRNNFGSTLPIICEGLDKNNTIEELGLAEIKLSLNSLKALGDILVKPYRKLRKLDLSKNEMNNIEFTSELGRIISHTGSLESLELSMCLINDETVIPIASALPENHSLKSLNLSYNKLSSLNSSHLFFHNLKKCKHLETLYIGFEYYNIPLTMQQEVIDKDKILLQNAKKKLEVYIKGEFYEVEGMDSPSFDIPTNNNNVQEQNQERKAVLYIELYIMIQ